jgi:hypothetical protein
MLTRTKTVLFALSLGTVAVAIATPSWAEVRAPGQARNNAARETAIHECSVANQRYHGAWAGMQVARYRACMADHGESE